MDTERASDTMNIRGYSTDQRISIESMNVNIRRLEHQKRETKLVGLSIQESAIGRQITSAENRAKERCPTYNPNNAYWRRVDGLVQQQSDCVFMMNKYNNDMMMESEKPEPVVTNISEFLNLPSPVKKKRNIEVMVDDDDEVSLIAFDIDDESNFDKDNIGTVDTNKTFMKNKKKRDEHKEKKKDKGYKVKKEKMTKATKATKVSTRSRKSTDK